jgi:hypothetical protein
MRQTFTTKIVVDGKEYANVEEMPPEVRAVYEDAMSFVADKDANGVPDILEGKGPGVWQGIQQAWSLARKVQRGGMSIKLSATRATTGPGAAAAPLASRPIAQRASDSPPRRRIEPTPAGGGLANQILVAIVVAIGVVLVLKLAGLIS